MHFLWPQGDTFQRQPPPDDPICQQIDQALEPIRPLIRGTSFDVMATGHRQVQIGLGADLDLFSVYWQPDALFIDLPVGEVFQRPADLLTVLMRHRTRSWYFRADSEFPARGQHSSPLNEVVLALEYATTPDRLPEVADLLLEGWRQKIMAQAMLQSLRGDHV